MSSSERSDNRSSSNHFPASVTYIGYVGLELRADVFQLFINATAGRNVLMDWRALQGGARVVF